jgi:HD-like signal output (HDOD) protein
MHKLPLTTEQLRAQLATQVNTELRANFDNKLCAAIEAAHTPSVEQQQVVASHLAEVIHITEAPSYIAPTTGQDTAIRQRQVR